MTRMAAADRGRRRSRWPAPRESASSPAAPLPANRSRTRASGRSGSRIANSVCLTRSPSGRVSPPGPAMRIPRARPAIDPPGVRHPSSVLVVLAGLAGRHAPEPAARQLAAEGVGTGTEVAALIEQRLGMRTRAHGQLPVAPCPGATRHAAGAGRSGRDRGRCPRGAARSRALGQLEAVARLGDRLQPGLGHLVGRVGHEDAERIDRPATDPATELVELGEPEPVRALDDHHRRLRHVHPDLDDRRAHQDVELAVAEPGHLGVAVSGLHPAVDQAHPQRLQQRPQADRLALGRHGRLGLGARVVDQRHDDERAVAGGRLGRAPAATCPRDRPAGGSRSGSARDRRAACAGPTHRGRRRAPARASAGSAWRSSAGRAVDARRPSPRARHAGSRRTGAARR